MPTESNSKALLCAAFVFFLGCVQLTAGSTHALPPNDSTTVIAKIDTLVAYNGDTILLADSPTDARAQIVLFAKNFIGKRYIYGGKDTTGFDCSGFTHYVMRNFAVKVSPSSRMQATEGKKITVKEVKSGDLIFFKRSKKSRISHVAMVVSNDEKGLFIIHSTSRGVVIDNLWKSKYWRPKVYSARDIVSIQAPKLPDPEPPAMIAQNTSATAAGRE